MEALSDPLSITMIHLIIPLLTLQKSIYTLNIKLIEIKISHENFKMLVNTSWKDQKLLFSNRIDTMEKDFRKVDRS
jgi:hypothetical protein